MVRAEVTIIRTRPLRKQTNEINKEIVGKASSNAPRINLPLLTDTLADNAPSHDAPTETRKRCRAPSIAPVPVIPICICI